MNRPSSAATAGATERTGPSRRTLLRTGAWSAPVVLVAATAPAYAASAGITGTQQAVRSSATAVDSSGTVTNNTGADQTVTLTWTWICDSTGPGAGRFTGGSGLANGWTVTSFVFVAGSGDAQRGARLIATRVIPAGATVPLPTITMNPSAATVTGTVTATLVAPVGVSVLQPPVVTFPPFTAARQAPAMRQAPARGPGVLVLGG